jgi:hypothetical protein
MQITNINAKAAFFFLREAGRTLSGGGRVITCVHSFTPCMHASTGALAAAACLTLAQLLSPERHQPVTLYTRPGRCTPQAADQPAERGTDTAVCGVPGGAGRDRAVQQGGRQGVRPPPHLRQLRRPGGTLDSLSLPLNSFCAAPVTQQHNLGIVQVVGMCCVAMIQVCQMCRAPWTPSRSRTAWSRRRCCRCQSLTTQKCLYRCKNRRRVAHICAYTDGVPMQELCAMPVRLVPTSRITACRCSVRLRCPGT